MPGKITGSALAVLGDRVRVDVHDRLFGYFGQSPGLFGSEPEGLRTRSDQGMKESKTSESESELLIPFFAVVASHSRFILCIR